MIAKRAGDGYVCSVCGAELDLPYDAVPKVKYEISAAGRIRVLTVDREEVHRCEMFERRG
jgi:hypothetical protein